MKPTKHIRSHEIYQYHETKTKRRRPFVIALFVLMIIGVVIYFYLSFVLNNLKQSYQVMQTVQAENEVVLTQQIQQQHPIALWVVGIDDGLGGKLTQPRATLMALTEGQATTKPLQHYLLSPTIQLSDNKSLSDTFVSADLQQIQATAQQLLNLPIDYTIELKLSKLRPLLDELGGVTLSPTLAFNLEGKTLVAHQAVHLSAREAMLYMQRQNEQENLATQGQRQFEVVTGILAELAQWQEILQLKARLTLLQEAATTNLPFDRLVQLIQNGYLSDYLNGTARGVTQLNDPILHELAQRLNRN